MKNPIVKAGDLVRIGRRGDAYHGVKFGAVCEVEDPDFWGDGRAIRVRGPMLDDPLWRGPLQCVQDWQLAKQATKKRAAYADRRG